MTRKMKDKKSVRIDARTIIMVDRNIPNYVAIKRYLEKLERYNSIAHHMSRERKNRTVKSSLNPEPDTQESL